MRYADLEKLNIGDTVLLLDSKRLSFFPLEEYPLVLKVIGKPLDRIEFEKVFPANPDAQYSQGFTPLWNEHLINGNVKIVPHNKTTSILYERPKE